MGQCLTAMSGARRGIGAPFPLNLMGAPGYVLTPYNVHFYPSLTYLLTEHSLKSSNSTIQIR